MRSGNEAKGGWQRAGRVRDALVVVLVVTLLVWALSLQAQVTNLTNEVAALKAPIVVTGHPDRQFSSVNDLALALLRVHDREKGLEASLEDDIHSTDTALIHTHQYIDNKQWTAGVQK